LIYQDFQHRSFSNFGQCHLPISTKPKSLITTTIVKLIFTGRQLDEAMCMHYGYWDDSTPHHKAAVQMMNKQVAEAGKIIPGQHVLDAGCGVGGAFHISCEPGLPCRGHYPE
jgi:hypothetical protein